MTILILNPPDNKECMYHVWTDVVSCTDTHIKFRDGRTCRKPICAKVEILSVLDVPSGGYKTWCDFTKPLLREFAEEHGFEFGVSYVDIKDKKNFERIDLLTHI